MFPSCVEDGEHRRRSKASSAVATEVDNDREWDRFDDKTLISGPGTGTEDIAVRFVMDDTVNNGSLACCSMDSWGPPSTDKVIGGVELRGRVSIGLRMLSILMSTTWYK